MAPAGRSGYLCVSCGATPPSALGNPMKPILAALLVMFTAQAAAAETPIYEVAPATTDASFYIVGPRDVLEITIYGEEDLSRVVTVSDTGDISMPFIGVQRVAQLSPPEIARALDKAFQEGGFLVHPHTSVRVAEFRSQAVEVIGAVAKPGLYYMQGPTLLSRVIADAGWIDLATASGQVTIVHLDGSTEVVDLNDLTRPDAVAANKLLVNGDRVSVGEGQVFYVSGQVGKDGKYAYKNGLTAWRALAVAGGPNAVARLSGAYVIRGDQRIPVNLKRIRRGREEDFLLQPNDTLHIPESAI